MRWISTIFCVSCATFWTVACSASINTQVYTATAPPGSNPDANYQTKVWTIYTNPDASGTGVLLGNSDSNGAGGMSGAGAGSSAWGFQLSDSISDVTASASIIDLIGRPLMYPGESVAIDFDNGLVPSDAIVGVLFHHNNPFESNQAALVYQGDHTDYTLVDKNLNGLPTGVNFTTDGFNVKLTLIDTAGTYQLDVGNCHFDNRMLYDGTSNIGTIEIAAVGLGSDPNTNPSFTKVFFNNLTITTNPPVPEASSAATWAIIIVLGLSAWAGRQSLRKTALRSHAAAEVARF